MKKNLFKKVIVVLAALIMVFGFAACGGGGGDNYVTPEKYLELRDADWPNMEQAEMEDFLGVKGVIDEESTDNWGEGYEVIDFPGVDDDSYLHVLFQQNDDGSWRCASIQPLGELAEAIE